VNKMDLVDFSQEVFDNHRRGLEALAERLQIPELIAVPVSALEGDNVVHRSTRIPWYTGPSLLELLETVPLAIERSQASLRFPIQRVLRPHQDFRGFAGQIAAGTVRPGDEILALPSGRRTRVRSINTWEGDLALAHAPQSVVLTLEDEVDLSRGEMIAAVAAPPHKTTRFNATIVWMQNKALEPGATYLLKHTTQTVRAQVAEIRSRIDVVNLAEGEAEQLGLNDIGEIVLETSRPILADLYRDNRTTGSFILIDAASNATAGAGMIRSISDVAAQTHAIAGLLTIGNRPQLAAQLEQALLQAGALVLRTRVAATAQLLAFVRLGAFVIVESDAAAPITFARADALNVNPTSIESVDAEQIVNEIDRIGTLPTGDENDNGLGI
jgi:sulfate adenylyltransferase subunit 1